MQNVILNSVVQRLQRYSAKYFCTQEYKITNAVWDRPNKKAIITLDQPLKQYLGLPQKIVVENIPYAWEVQDISIDLLSRSILIETVNNTILHGYKFSGNLLSLSGVIVRNSNNTVNNGATALLNQFFTIALDNERANNIIALNIPVRSVDIFKNLLFYKSFEGEEGLIFDCTNAKILFYPKEDSTLRRINRLYEPTIDFTITADPTILELNLDDYFCQDSFFEGILADGNSVVYTSPQIEIGDSNDFNLYIHKKSSSKKSSIQQQEDFLKYPICFARVSYIGHSQRTPTGSVDDTMATSQVANIKQNYQIIIGIIDPSKQYIQENTSGGITNSQGIEPLKVNIHNNIVQVLQDCLVNYGFDDLTYANNRRIAINFDNDSSVWEIYQEPDNIPCWATVMTIQTVYDEKKISRLEKMIITQPMATGVHLQTHAQDINTPKNIVI
jgi:hypothetical protein